MHDEKAVAISSKWASINAALQNGAFKALIGEGDYDPAISKRIETGLLAIAALKGSGSTAGNTVPAQSHNNQGVLTAALTTGWAIQIGAFSPQPYRSGIKKSAGKPACCPCQRRTHDCTAQNKRRLAVSRTARRIR